MNNFKNISWQHSKTSFMRGRQCVKSMYLHRFNRELKTKPSESETKLSNKGLSFEKQFRNTHFPHGIDLKSKFNTDFAKYEAETNQLLTQLQECVIFEAGLLENNVLILVDVLQKNMDNTYQIFEVKNGSKMKSEYLWDAALQYYVCKAKFGEKLKSFNLVLKGRNNSFKIIEVSKQAEKKQHEIFNLLQNFSKILESPIAPEIEMGKHCNVPHICDFKGFCNNYTNKPKSNMALN